MSHSREHLKQAPGAYFDAVDAKDMEAALSFFADDATFTIQTVPVTLTGKAEIRGMFEHFFGDYSHIEHNITNLVVDEAEGRASTEQSCPHIKTDGTLDHAITCNFFSFNEDGKFTRVIVWIDVASPLRK
ncbi:MAG: nuclear transport factor 2 family protein [Thermoleophilia bacterium]|jgi:ketosteroid isomerase-like protein